MSTYALTIVNGAPRNVSLAGISLPAIYDQRVTIVASGGTSGTNSQNAGAAGTVYTLPLSQTYTGVNLQVYWNGQRLDETYDWNPSGSNPYSAITFTFAVVAGDFIDFRIDRN